MQVCVCACTHLPVLSFLTLKEGNALKTPAVEYLQLSGPCWIPQQILEADQPKNCWGMQATTIQHDKYINLVCEKHSLAPCWVTVVSMPQHTIHSVYPKHLGEEFVEQMDSHQAYCKRSPGWFSFLESNTFLKENSSLDRARDSISSITFYVGGLFSRPHLQCC